MDQARLHEAFREEATDYLNVLSQEIISLERDPSNGEAIRRMFIAAHSIKAGGAIVDSEPVRVLAHAVEDLLASLREHPRAFSSDVADLLLASVDTLRLLVADANTATQPGAKVSDLVTAVRTLAGRIPAATGPPSPAQPRKAQPRRGASRRKRPGETRRALLVEDSPTVRLLETMLLTEEGFAVDAFDDPRAALERLLQDRYDLVVTGMETRGLTGLDFVAALRDQQELGSLPVIVTDTEDDPQQRQQALDLGVMDYVRTGSLRNQRLSRAARKAMRSS